MKINQIPLPLHLFLNIARTVPDTELDISKELILAFCLGMDYGRNFSDSPSYFREIAEKLAKEGIEETQ